MSATADDVISALEQAKQKLSDAKSKGLQAASTLGRAHASVGHVLGHSGSGNPLLSELRLKEKALVEQVMKLDTLISRIDTAIAQARSASVGRGPASGAVAR